jgi:hypothetical protein
MVKCLIIMIIIVKKENYMNSCSCKASMCIVPAIQRVEKLRESKSEAGPLLLSQLTEGGGRT